MQPSHPPHHLNHSSRANPATDANLSLPAGNGGDRTQLPRTSRRALLSAAAGAVAVWPIAWRRTASTAAELPQDELLHEAAPGEAAPREAAPREAAPREAAPRGDDRSGTDDLEGGPRATSGDAAREPRWDERLEIRVGPREADLVGSSDRVLQAAVDYVAALGGGTVRILPGEYRLRNAVHLRSGVRIVGSRADSVLVKEPSQRTLLARDSDWYDQEITLADPTGFQIGDGVLLEARNPHHGGQTVLKRTLVARSGSRFKLDRPLRENLWRAGEASCASLFPLITANESCDLAIEDVVLDGRCADNENLNGNWGGCIFLQDVSRCLIRGVTARNYNGDGISWQVAHDVRVEACESRGHAGLGLHPGSGSQRPVIRGNRIEDCSIGIFFCWGVKFGLAEENRVEECGVGISIGHRDTDNRLAGNLVRGSRQTAVLFRPERGQGFTGDRNRLVENVLEDNGPEDGAAVDVEGLTDRLVLERNRIVETRSPARRAGIRLGAEVGEVQLIDNQITGFAQAVDDRRPA